MDNVNINNNVDTDLQEQGKGLSKVYNDNVNNEAPEGAEAEKTFTQQQLNDIVEKRLAKERKRLMGMIDDDEATKAELLKNRLQLQATKKLTEEGYPIDLAELLDYSNDDTYNASYSKVVEVFERALNKKINERFKSYGRQPQNTDATSVGGSSGLRSAFGLKGD